MPEFQDSDDQRDPFPTDIYYLGNMIRQNCLTANGLRFMEPLVGDMVQADPPSIKYSLASTSCTGLYPEGRLEADWCAGNTLQASSQGWRMLFVRRVTSSLAIVHCLRHP